MNLNAASMLKAYVLGLLAEGTGPSRGTRTPCELRMLAVEALRKHTQTGQRDEATVDDLVNDLVVKLLDRDEGLTRLAQRQAWEARPPRVVAAYLRTLLERIVIDQAPDRSEFRSVSELVRKAVARGLPPFAEFPASIQKNGRYRLELVAEACRAQLIADRRSQALTGDLARQVFERYHAQPVAQDPGTEDHLEAQVPTPETGCRSEARQIVEIFVATAPNDACAVLACCGRDFEALAENLAVAKSTAHRRYGDVLEAFGRAVRRVTSDAASGLRALELICARAGAPMAT